MDYNISVPLRILDSIIIHKIKIETIFNDIMEIPDIAFADISINEEKEIFTEYNSLKLESDIFKIIKSISVQISKYITGKGEIIKVVEKDDETIDITQEQLKDIRKLYGSDAVNRAYKNDSGWVCYCGMKNDSNDHICQLCKREVEIEALSPVFKDGYIDAFCLYDHIDYINSLKNAKEIYDYLEKLNCIDTYFNAIVLPEIKKYISSERMYGSMKNSVISKLKELCLKD